MQILDSGF